MPAKFDHPIWYPGPLRLAAMALVVIVVPVAAYLFSRWCVIAVEVRSDQAVARLRAAYLELSKSKTVVTVGDIQQEEREAERADPRQVDTAGYLQAGWETLPAAGAVYREWRESPVWVEGARVHRRGWFAPSEYEPFVYAPGWHTKPARVRWYIGVPLAYTVVVVTAWAFMRQRYKVWVLEGEVVRLGRQRRAASGAEEATRACPHCGGVVPAYAEACRHCKRILAGGGGSNAAQGTSPGD